ncbi:hypothetical protein FKM82_022323 [Ascaphus truei]
MKFVGMEVEWELLRSRGLSHKVAQTMAARKRTTSTVYHRIWQQFHQWCEQQGVSFLEPPIPETRVFARRSRTMAQVSALLALLGRLLTAIDLISRFFQAWKKINPQKRDLVPAWDLSLVLWAVTDAPF